MAKKTENSSSCKGNTCCSQGKDVTRRQFLSLAGVTTAGAVIGGMNLPVMAGPFTGNEYLETIPVDKRLSPSWVASLTARGEPTVYNQPAALEHIGMPVGGLFCGTVYLGGDGRLWLWDIFNHIQLGIEPRKVEYKGKKVGASGGANYVSPAPPEVPIAQGFALKINGKVRRLDRSGFKNIHFMGQYPIGQVNFDDGTSPVAVTLEAYSPFIPMDTDDSSLPVIVMSYRLKNKTSHSVDTEISGWLENGVCLYHRDKVSARRVNRILKTNDYISLACQLEPTQTGESARKDIVFEDFEKNTYEGWEVTGTAFGDSPLKMADMPGYQGRVGGKGERVVNSHNVRHGEDVREGDRHTGTLTSKSFVISRRYINFLIGGGAHKNKTCMNLLVNGKVVQSATGHNQNLMQWESFPVAHLQGHTARLQIVDREQGSWGNIGVDQIVFSDRPAQDVPLAELHDFGTMSLALLGRHAGDLYTAAIGEPADFVSQSEKAAVPVADKLTGALGRRLKLQPGQERQVTFIIAWHFPNLSLAGMKNVGRYYASRFQDAQAVTEYVAGNFPRLSNMTRLWRSTWYDSTLPYWFLDRTMANTTTLATSTCYRFRNGRFWAWEGIGCCQGTCTHVWHYAQAMARLFPEVERDQRERVDYGLAFDEKTGIIGFRANMKSITGPAHDGQCGTILRAYREHQMAPDDAFLKRCWPRIKKSVQYMIDQDGNADGMVEGSQPNTLDAAWFGKISFLASLYLATLRAGEEMASEVGDTAFADKCRKIAQRGRKSIAALFNGEFFIQEEDPSHMDAIGVGGGCYIDQVFGQSWAFQVHLGRIFNEKQIKTALQSLWKYNFAPDVGPFRNKFRQGRWYAMAGDAGLIMCTWPKGGKRKDWEKHWQYMYFNECMSGFEWEVASHMIWEGMITEGMALARAIHDRYNAVLRNPYNEIECSDHYARAMASYGAFLAAGGYEYHGPKGYLAFAPRLSPEDFRTPFTTAQGWGTFSQQYANDRQNEVISLKYGRLELNQLKFRLGRSGRPSKLKATLNSKVIPNQYYCTGKFIRISFPQTLHLQAGDTLSIAF